MRTNWVEELKDYLTAQEVNLIPRLDVYKTENEDGFL